MPALTPEQRQQQIKLAKRRKAQQEAANKPKPGQKGAPTGPGSGVVRYSSKPAAKPAAKDKPKVSNIPPGEGTGKGSPNDNLPKAAKPKAAPKPQAPAPSRPAAAASAPKPAAPMPKSSGTSKPSPASESYRDGGKGLYQGSKEYRDKVGGSGNPLLNRLRKDMGRDTSTGDRVSPSPDKSSKAEYNVSQEEGKRRLAEGLRKMQEERDKQKKGTSSVVSS